MKDRDTINLLLLLYYTLFTSVHALSVGFLIPFHSEWFACAYGRCDTSPAVPVLEVVVVVRSGYE